MSHNQITLAIIQDAISDVTCLFSLPEVYLRIRELMDDEHSDLDDFSNIVSTDPNLTASVLKIVNSAYFGFTGQIANIHQSLNLLGIGALHDLVLSISAVSSLSMPNEIIELSCFWRRSIYCGVLSKLIAEHKKLKDPGSLFVIGLLHEIGHLLFFFKFPKQSMMALTESVQNHRSLFEIEREIFNVHYGEAGQQLMKAWNLPVKFQLITEFHPEPGKAKEHILETAIVHIAHHYACAKESDDDPLGTIDAPAWQLLDSTPKLMNDEILNEADLMSRELEKLIIR
ncbi:MAG: HDOD domain-containing protein [Bacteroidia bacterium]|nr:HDOD domain-containing protein [Bacteroidia bacterium]